MADLSKTKGYVPLAMFLDMNKRFKDYNKSHDPDATIVYLDSKKVDFVTAETFKQMQYRFDQYKLAHNNAMPTVVYFQKPVAMDTTVTPAPTERKVGALQSRLEAIVGRFNTFTEFYNKSKGRGYKYYYNDCKTLEEEIIAYKNKSGLNCADAVQLFAHLAMEMGYKVAYEHCQCKTGGHMRLLIDGKEFGNHGDDSRNWKLIDPAACLSVGSQYAIGNVWCAYAGHQGITKPDGAWIGENLAWMRSDDGRT